VINRVFNAEHNQGVFVHFDNYLKKLLIKEKSLENNLGKDFNFKLFRKWIDTEDPEKLV
jgi:hypothetical protein